jgi:trimethylamine-N-oxide reductase cytochrome c-type subunit TorC
MKRLWRFIFRPSPRYALGLLVVVGGVLGILAWGGFHTAMEYTNKLEFCISCHEMRDTVYQEYKTSIHYSNPAGVRAVCADCHVPRGWLPKIVRKIYATNELYHHLVGTIDTPEKFEKHRLKLAQNVWATMKKTDSRECRNCHAFEAMDFEHQKPEAKAKMQQAWTDGGTCIDCHKGIAHKLPDMSQGYKQMLAEMMDAAHEDAAKAETLYTLTTKPLFLDRAAASPDGTPDGKLIAASEVKVLERDGDWLKVRIEGWQQQDAERVLNAMQGKRIMVAALTDTAVEKVKQLETMTDPDTELVWHRAELEAWIAADAVTADQKKMWDYGAEMYSSTCSVCHTLMPPGHFLANQWIGNLNAMKRFISIDDEQFRFLQKYVQMHAQDTGGHHE